MTDLRRGEALERRYDGPIPARAALPPDVDCNRTTRIANRRRWAWCHVRAIGHELVRAGRAFRVSGDPAAFRRWNGLRRELAHALRSWQAFRDWHAALSADNRKRDAS